MVGDSGAPLQSDLRPARALLSDRLVFVQRSLKETHRRQRGGAHCARDVPGHPWEPREDVLRGGELSGVGKGEVGVVGVALSVLQNAHRPCGDDPLALHALHHVRLHQAHVHLPRQHAAHCLRLVRREADLRAGGERNTGSSGCTRKQSKRLAVKGGAARRASVTDNR